MLAGLGARALRVGVIFGLCAGLFLDLFIGSAPWAVYLGMALAVAGLANVALRVRRQADPTTPLVGFSISASYTLYVVSGISLLFARSGGVIAGSIDWLVPGGSSWLFAILSLWPFAAGLGISAVAFMFAQYHATRSVCLARYPLYVAMPAIAAPLLLAPPPTIEVVAPNYGRIGGKDGPRVVHLAREQKQVKLFTDYLPLFPTGARYIYITPAQDAFWQIDNVLQPGLKSNFDGRIRTPMWRRFQGTLGIAAIFLLLAATAYLRRLDRDRRDWAKVVDQDTFAGYREFIKLCADHKRTGFFISRGRTEMLKRKGEFATYLQILTHANRKAPLRDWLLSVMRSSASMDGIPLGITFSGDHVSSDFKSDMRRFIREQEHVEPDLDWNYARRTLGYKTIHQIDQVIDQRYLKETESLVVKVLEALFAAVLGERVVVFRKPDEGHNAALNIRYRIHPTLTLFWHQEPDVAEAERPYYRGVEFEWLVEATQFGFVFAHARMNSRPSARFKSLALRDTFERMTATSFVEFGRELLGAMGLSRSTQLVREGDDLVNELARELMKEVKNVSKDQLTEQFIEDFVVAHEDVVRAVVDAICLRLERAGMEIAALGLQGWLEIMVGEGVAGAIELDF